MIKMTRRDSIKVISVAGIAAIAPSISRARSTVHSDSSPELPCDSSPQNSVCTHPQADIDLTIHPIAGKIPSEDYALVKIWNRSNESSTLRYIYPGVVQQEGAFYDLNSLLTNGELTLEGLQIVYRRLQPMQQAADRLNPPNQIAKSGHVIVRNMHPVSQRNRESESIRSVLA